MRRDDLVRLALGFGFIFGGLAIALPADEAALVVCGAAFVWGGVAMICLGPSS